MLTPAQAEICKQIRERYERKVLSSYLRKETAEDKAFHYYMRGLWVRTCDSFTDYKRKATRFCINTARAVAALVRK